MVGIANVRNSDISIQVESIDRGDQTERTDLDEVLASCLISRNRNVIWGS
jgi:hypothetical protein